MEAKEADGLLNSGITSAVLFGERRGTWKVALPLTFEFRSDHVHHVKSLRLCYTFLGLNIGTTDDTTRLL